MIFKKIFYLFFILILSSCSLYVGESSITSPVLSLSRSSCSEIDTAETIYNYLYGDSSEKETKEWERVLNCLNSKLEVSLKLTRTEQITKKEYNKIIEALRKEHDIDPENEELNNQDSFSYDLLKLDEGLGLKKAFNDKEKLPYYMLIKQDVVQMMSNEQISETCRVPSYEDDPVVVTKEEVQRLQSFSTSWPDLFKSIDENSARLYQTLLDEDLNFRAYIEVNPDIFVALVEESLPEDMSEIASFLQSLDSEKREEMFQAFFSYLNVQWREEVLGVQDIKYLFFGLYMAEAFFKVYDLNQDRILDPKELEAVSCYLSYFMSIVRPDREEDKMELVRYFFIHQVFPTGISEQLKYSLKKAQGAYYEIKTSLTFLELFKMSRLILEASGKKLKENLEKKAKEKEEKAKAPSS